MSPATQAEPEKVHVAKELKHKSPLIACRFDPKGRFVFASAEDDSVQRWDLETGKQTALAGHDSWVFALAVHPSGETLLTGGGDGQLFWWPARADAPVPSRRVRAHAGWIRSVAVSPDGALVATAGNDRRVKVWSCADGSLVHDLPAHSKPVYRVAFDPSGKFLFSADLQGLVVQWDHKPGKEAGRFDAAKLYAYNAGQGVDFGGVRDLTFSADGKYLACGGLIEASNPLGAVCTPAVVLLDRESGKELRLQRPKEDIKGVVWGLRFHPSGFLVAASGGTPGGYLFFWKPDQVSEFFKFKLPNTARDLDLHPDGLRLATAHFDGQLRVCMMSLQAAGKKT
ncbi:MAG: WD40 repeat domain-containing protein [Isosphaeraceae bacterium]|nr:WD40 repeat domain-containing protein [Isosphaeraceae bacterium]